jgi:hypothetical protein
VSREASDTASQLQDLISRALRQQVRSSQRVADLLRRIASGELNGQQVREEFQQFSQTEAAEYVSSLTNAGISFFSHLLELNDNFNERLFGRLGQNGGQREENGSTPRARLPLRGAVGSVVKATFTVENRREGPSDVSLVFPKILRSDGFAFQAPFVAEPAAFRLGPGEERPVQIALQLLPELFVVGQQYSGQMIVRGPEDMLLDIDIVVEPSVENVVEPAPAAKSGRAAPRATKVPRGAPARKSKRAKKRTARRSSGGTRENPA